MIKRTKLDDRQLPNYTRGNEIFNSVSHMVGGAVGITATVLCVVFAAKHHDAYKVVGASIFGASMILLYAISAIYHALSPRLKAKKVMQVLDHCTIFVLIAGSYTPIALGPVREYSTALGWTLFGCVWAVAALGITLNAIDLKRYNTFSLVLYLVMGWCIVLVADHFYDMFGFGGIILLVSGGIAYTIGAVLYGIGAKKPVMHSVFHIFTVIGSILHFLAILLYVV
jgi:hemolysin III